MELNWLLNILLCSHFNLVFNNHFQELCEMSDRSAKEKQFTTSESERQQNRGLNRYRDVNPYDHSRIVLKRGTVDYINANLVKVSLVTNYYCLKI